MPSRFLLLALLIVLLAACTQAPAADIAALAQPTRFVTPVVVRMTATLATPGPTDTPMHAGVSAELKERIAAGLPVGRMGHPRDMAAAALFLCSPAANFVYGASLNVDGGALFE